MLTRQLSQIAGAALTQTFGGYGQLVSAELLHHVHGLNSVPRMRQ